MYCGKYHLVGPEGKMGSSQFKHYLRTKIITSLYSWKIFFSAINQTLDSNQVARFGRPGRSWLISFLVSFPEENCGRKWNLKTSTTNNLSEILVSVKFRISVSVPSLFKHVWVFGKKTQEREKKMNRGKNSLIMRCEGIYWNGYKVHGALGDTGPLPNERTYSYLYGLCVFVCACL